MPIDMHDYPPAARRYWWTTVIAGSCIFAWAAWQLAQAPWSVIAQSVAWAAMAAIVGLFPVHIPATKTSFACGDIFIVLALLLVGVPAGVVACVVEAFVGASRRSKRWTSRLGSPSMGAISMLACGSSLEWMRQHAGAWFAQPAVGLLAAVTAYGVLYYLASTTVMYTLFALKSRERVRLIAWWRDQYLICLWFVASAAVAALIYLALEQFGWATLVVAMPVIAMFLSTYFAMQRAEEISRRKSEFLARMSHELRTPLNAIIGGSEVLKDGIVGALNPRQAQWADDIHESGKHLLTLINDILDISKIESGRMDLDRKPLSVAHAIADAMALVKDSAMRKRIELDAEVSPDAGTLHADERKLKQVLLNLLSNAIKFTPEGGRVRVTGRRARGAVEIAVEDNGIGIAAEDRETVFDPFRQVGNDAGKAQGTGLGLTLARDLVALHGGTLSLESEPGRGSVFTVHLPDHDAVRAPA